MHGHTQPVSELSRGCKQAAPNTELRRAPILGSKQAVTRQALLLVSLSYRHAGSQPIVTSAVTGGLQCLEHSGGTFSASLT